MSNPFIVPFTVCSTITVSWLVQGVSSLLQSADAPAGTQITAAKEEAAAAQQAARNSHQHHRELVGTAGVDAAQQDLAADAEDVHAGGRAAELA
jgi:cytochrome c551/c552